MRPMETKSATKVGTTRQRRFREAHPREIVGVDGEGMDVDGRHVYVLLRAGDKSIVNVKGLSSHECLSFLADLDASKQYVAFAFSYDVTMILKDLSEYKLRRLVDRSTRQRSNGFGSFPVTWLEEFEIDWLPGKEFRVKRVGAKHWVIVNDVWGFFQGKFCTNDPDKPGALEKWDIGSPEIRARIAAGKIMRGRFDEMSMEEIADYNGDEIVCLEELMRKFVDTCKAAGYVPRKLQGAGQLAEAMLSKHGVPKGEDLYRAEDREVWQYGRMAYYGGRFETAYVGAIKKPVYQYDINSAYIDAMIDPRYPCLVHGKWKRVVPGTPVEELDDIALIEVVYSRISRSEEQFRGYLLDGCFPGDKDAASWRDYPLYTGLPTRDKQGCISYRYEGRGWYWSFEVMASIHQSSYVVSGWEYVRRCDCRPMGFMADIYQERLRIGKDGKGQILKIGMASVYGKKVQSVGRPKYSNPIEGSFITSHCREKVQLLLHALPECSAGRCGDSVAFIATDAIATVSRPVVEVSDRLGAFSEEVHPEGMFLIQPGLYYGSKGGRSMKTRGVGQSLIWDKKMEFESAFQALCGLPFGEAWVFGLPETNVHVRDQRLVGIRLALAQNRLDELGQWPVAYRSIGFNWGTKRTAGAAVNNDLIKTWPYLGYPCTVPYDKNIGGIDDFESARQFLEDEPDWSRVVEKVE